MDHAPGRGRFHWSPDDPLCPLCGQDLGLAPRPKLPCETLEALALHFQGDCPVTERMAPKASRVPRPARPLSGDATA